MTKGGKAAVRSGLFSATAHGDWHLMVGRLPDGRIPDRVERVAALLHHDRTRLRPASGETATDGGEEEKFGLENRT